MAAAASSVQRIGRRNRLLRLPAVGDNAAMQTEPSNAEPPKHKRRWFQYSLRSLMIFVALVAVVCGYVGWQAKIVRERRAMRAEINRLGGDCVASPITKPEFMSVEPGDFRLLANLPSFAPLIDGNDDEEPSKIRRWLGDLIVWGIWLPDGVSHSDAVRFAKCFPEASVWQGDPSELTGQGPRTLHDLLGKVHGAGLTRPP
jgi:hypothetical protein